ncbi:MAG: ketopantoate reductase family protein [Clostridia bacterium]|nr:ketopantoate reductase family protein [Clostridia bacterium]
MKNILLIGLGAIGSMVASKFPDNNVKIDILLDEERYQSYKNKPIIINDCEYAFNYVTNSSYNKKCDLAIIATKYDDLPAALSELDGLLGDNCTIMSLLNGIDSENIISEKFGEERCIYAFITKTDATRVGRSTSFIADGHIYFGEKNGEASQRTKTISDILSSVGMSHSIVDDILTRQWKKFMINIGMNQVSAILGATYGDFIQVPEVLDLTVKAMREAVSVANAMGIPIKESDIHRALAFLSSLSPDGKTSMHQDVDAKRKTEVNMLAGVLIELGKKYNVATPINDVFYLQIKAIEKMYGK